MNIEGIGRSVALSALLILVPTSAYAVNVSSEDGSGEQHSTARHGNGATVDGKLRSTDGDAVYYQGRVVWGRCSDSGGERYTGNTRSRSSIKAGGQILALPGIGCRFDGVQSKVCRDISHRPDPCGPWSRRY